MAKSSVIHPTCFSPRFSIFYSLKDCIINPAINNGRGLNNYESSYYFSASNKNYKTIFYF